MNREEAIKAFWEIYGNQIQPTAQVWCSLHVLDGVKNKSGEEIKPVQGSGWFFYIVHDNVYHYQFASSGSWTHVNSAYPLDASSIKVGDLGRTKRPE